MEPTDAFVAGMFVVIAFVVVLMVLFAPDRKRAPQPVPPFPTERRSFSMQLIQNGDKVRDKVTGFEGIVTGVADYLTGCRQVLIAAPSKDGKVGEAQWYDDDRCELLASGAVTLPDRRRDGGPQAYAAPVR